MFIFLCLDVQLYKSIQRESRFNVSCLTFEALPSVTVHCSPQITITVKAVMLDHVNTYLLQPVSELLVDVTHFPIIFPHISANHISYLGVVFAFIAARLVLSDHLYIRRIAVFAFLIRQFLDDLDGLVARYHLGIDTKKQVCALKSSSVFLSLKLFACIGFIAAHQRIYRGWNL